MSGLHQVLKAPELLEMAQEVLRSGPEFSQMESEKRLKRAREEADWVKEERDRGFPILHSHAIVALWSILEVLVEDLIVVWLMNRRDDWKKDEISKLKMDIGTYHALSDEQRARYLFDALGRSMNVALRSGIGRFDNLLGVFGLSPPVGPNIQRALHELCQVRNVIVHCGSLADQRLIRECPWLNLQIGDRVHFSHPVYGWYAEAVERYEERILNQALISFGNTGCTCPGTDEIEARPLLQTGAR